MGEVFFIVWKVESWKLKSISFRDPDDFSLHSARNGLAHVAYQDIILVDQSVTLISYLYNHNNE